MIDFIYYEEYSAFMQILFLGSLLSLPVCYAVEALKNTGIKSGQFYFIMSIIISALFAVGFAKAFTDMSILEASMLGVCIWLGSQGFYERLKESDGIMGRNFVSLSERFAENKIEDIVVDDEDVKENVQPEITLPEAENRDITKNQIKILVSDLRIRTSPNGEILGYAKKGKYYTYSDVIIKYGIKWYHVGDCCIGDSGSGDLAVCEAGDYMIYPLSRYVTITTAFSKDHPAVDFGWSRERGGANQDIVCPYDMKVAKCGYDKTIGNYIYAHITYEGIDFTLRFIHLSKLNVAKGQTVNKGEVIGKMGNTGSSSSGSHLHFDIIKGHVTSLPDKRYENSVNAINICYASEGVFVNEADERQYNIMMVKQ